MNLSDPISSIIPSGHGAVLEVLARTELPLSGRRIADLTRGRLSRSRTNEVLSELTATGVVRCDVQPPAKLYVLNRAHVAADAVITLASLRDRLLAHMRSRLLTWSLPPMAAWLFGSFARGEGGVRSDIDVLIVRPEEVATDDPDWTAQVDAFSTDVALWSGNACSVIDYSDCEFTRMVEDEERLAVDLRRDGILLAGRDLARRAPAAPR